MYKIFSSACHTCCCLLLFKHHPISQGSEFETLTLMAPQNKVDQEVTDLISIREVLGSNCDWDTDYAEHYRGCTQSLRANAGILP
jgi:hypothetical protein